MAYACYRPCADFGMTSSNIRGVRILAPVSAEYVSILTPEALAFVAHFARSYSKRVEGLLAQREVVQARFDAGVKPTFLPETRHVRESEWQVSLWQARGCGVAFAHLPP